ncbi:MAG: hypothetical protein RBR82_06245 [Pseudomonas sp.]|nr:hypothetical protein [Pseudomonas sp.]
MWYREGTISVTNGSTVVTGVNTYWAASIVAGDSLLAADKQYEITSVDSDTQLTLTTAYTGDTATGLSYAIIVISTTTSGLASRITNVATLWQTRENEIAAWQAGTLDGGPNLDGRYPLTAPDGTITYAYCPAAISAMSSGASDWADYPEDVEIPGFPGRYSSMHWSNKSEDSALIASSSEAALAPHYTAIDTVSTNIANVNTVAGMSNDIDAIILDQTNVDTVATNIASVNTVASDLTNIDAAVENATNINSVATNIANVNTVAGMSADIDAVLAGQTNIDTVATNIANVSSVAANATNINTVAADSADINTVISMASDIDAVVLNMTAIQNATVQAALAEDWATEAEDVLVNGTGYSAYHWAQKAANVVTGDLIDDTITSTTKTWSSSKVSGELAAVVVSETDPVFTAWDKSTGISITESQISDFGNYEPADATILKDADIGVTVQGYDANLPTWPQTVTATEVGYLDGVTSSIQTQIGNKQDTLVSGTNIKTVNSQSLLGTGDIVIESGSSYPSFTGNAGKALTVSEDETGVEWGNGFKLLNVFSAETIGKRAITQLGPMFVFDGYPNLSGTIQVGYNATTDLFFASSTSAVAYIITSSNGISWLQRAMPSSAAWIVATDAYAWIALASGTTNTAISTDGITWFEGPRVPTAASSVVTVDKVALFFVANSTTAYRGYNGGNAWTEGSTLSTQTLPSAYLNGSARVVAGNFFYKGVDGNHYISPNGYTGGWTQVTMPTTGLNVYGGSGNNIGMYNDTLLTVAGTNQFTSTDGINWSITTDLTVNDFPPINGIAFRIGSVIYSCGTYHTPTIMTYRKPVQTAQAFTSGGSATNGEIYVIGGANRVYVVDPTDTTTTIGLFEV